MSYDQFFSLHLTSICSVLNAWDKFRGEARANGNGLDRKGRSYLDYLGLNQDESFLYWLSTQNAGDYPQY